MRTIFLIAIAIVLTGCGVHQNSNGECPKTADYNLVDEGHTASSFSCSIEGKTFELEACGWGNHPECTDF